MAPEEPTPPAVFVAVLGAGVDSAALIGGALATGGFEVSEHPANSAAENPKSAQFTTETFIRICVTPRDKRKEKAATDGEPDVDHRRVTTEGGSKPT